MAMTHAPLEIESSPFGADDGAPTLSDALGGTTPKFVPRDRPSVTVIQGEGVGTLIPLGGGDVVFGRDKDVAGLADPGLSRRHARFFCVDHQNYVEDLGSANGTFVRGLRIGSPVRLEDGDLIQLGPDRILRFSLYDTDEENAAVRLYESSIQDPTTGAFNRRYLDDRIELELKSAKENAKPLALLLFDIDDFKSVNDSHGHQLGDKVLRVVSANIQRMLKPDDVLARYGGDEFVALCRETTLTNGLILAERIRSSTERLRFSGRGNEFQVTVSIGVASTLGDGDTGESLIGTADRALYQAKHQGRNSIAGGS